MIARAWRWLWRWLSGAWAHVPPRWTEEEIERLGLLNRLRFREWALQQPPPALITGLRIALEFGAWPRREPPFVHALNRSRRTNCKRGVPSCVVGRPVIYTFKNHVRIGETEWANDFVKREVQLAARKILKASTRMAA